MWNDKKARREMEQRISLLDIKNEALKDLAPCPFCGCDMNQLPGYMMIERWHLKKEEYRVVCPHCSAAGPGAQSIEWAAANWNWNMR